MIPRVVKILAGAATVVAMACVDISSPTDKPTAISLLQVPEFFVVINDVMRDTLGAPTKPALVSFDGAGNPVAGFNPAFFITDSVKFAVFDPSGVIAGKVLGTAHALGQIGNLQTPSTSIFVTVVPTKLRKTTVDSSLALKIGQDSSSSLATLALSATLLGDSAGPGTTPPIVAGGIVFFSLRSSIPQKPGGSPVAFLLDNFGNPSNVDTGKAPGVVSRNLVVNSFQIPDSNRARLILGTETDSVVVTAHITYKGTVIPTRFTILIKGPLI